VHIRTGTSSKNLNREKKENKAQWNSVVKLPISRYIQKKLISSRNGMEKRKNSGKEKVMTSPRGRLPQLRLSWLCHTLNVIVSVICRQLQENNWLQNNSRLFSRRILRHTVACAKEGTRGDSCVSS